MGDEDSIGQKIWEAVQRMSASVSRYAQRYYVRDPSVVAGSLVDAAVAVLRTDPEKLKQVRNLDAYLLRTFARHLRKQLARESKLVGIEFAENLPAPEDHVFCRVLATEILTIIGARMQPLFERWMEGHSWGEIGLELGIDPHLAEQQFYFGLRKLREKIGKPPVRLQTVHAEGRRAQSLRKRKTQSLDKYAQEGSR